MVGNWRITMLFSTTPRATLYPPDPIRQASCLIYVNEPARCGSIMAIY